MGRTKAYKCPMHLVKTDRSKNFYMKFSNGGTTVFRTTGTDDLDKAAKILAMVRGRVIEGSITGIKAAGTEGASIPFRKVLARYLTEISPKKSENGRNDINSSKALLRYFGEKNIGAITKQEILAFMENRKNEKAKQTNKCISGATANREKALLSHIFMTAIRWQYIKESPMLGVKGYSESNRTRYITNEEFESICQHMDQIPRAMFTLMYLTAQRPGKIFSLKWGQIDLQKRTITFESKYKNKRSPETLAITDDMFVILESLKYRAKISDYVFYNKNRRTFAVSAGKIWKTAAKKAGVTDTRVYDIRHMAVSDLLNSGIDHLKVGKIVGHSDPATTKRYFHMRPENTLEALNMLNGRVKLMNGPISE